MSFVLKDAQKALLEWICTNSKDTSDLVPKLFECETFPYFNDDNEIGSLNLQCVEYFEKLETVKDYNNLGAIFEYIKDELKRWGENGYSAKLEKALWNAAAVALLHFQYRLEHAENDCRLELLFGHIDVSGLLDSCVDFLLNADCEEFSRYTFYLNMLDLLITGLALQQFNEFEHNWLSSWFLRLPETLSRLLLLKLLGNFCALQPPLTEDDSAKSPSILIGAFQYIIKRTSGSSFAAAPIVSYPDELPPLSAKSLKLLASLLCESVLTECNVYRKLLSELQDAPPVFSFQRLYELLLRYLTKDRSMLVLFQLLLTESVHFKNHFYSRTDAESLLEGLLELLSNQVDASEAGGSAYVQLVSLCLLQLSSDDDYCQRVYAFELPHIPPWFKGRLVLKKLTLGSLSVLVLQHALLRNLSAIKDAGLHVTMLACFANFSQRADSLPVAVAQKLVSFVDVVDKRLLKVAASGPPLSDSSTMYSQALKDILSVLLECLDAIVLFRLPRNANLVYAMYHQQQIFRDIQSHFTENHSRIVNNIVFTIDYFQNCLHSANLFNTENQSPALEDIVSVLEQALFKWQPTSVEFHPLIHYSFQLDPILDYKFLLPIIFCVSSRG